MANAALGFTHHILCSPLSWSSGASSWRFAHFRSVRLKQEVKEFYLQRNGVLFLSLEGIRYHHQRGWHFLKKAYMSSFQSNDLILASSKQEQNHSLEASIQEFVHETSRQSLLLASNAEETGSNVDTSRNSPLVYKRRSRRNMIAEEVIIAKDLDIELKHPVPLQGPMEEPATKYSGRTYQKRKGTKKSSQHTESETATCSQITLESSQHTEVETIKSSQKKRVTVKDSQKRSMETTPGSQKRRVTAKTSQDTEEETQTSQCMEIVGGFEEKKKTERTSQSIDATGSEKHEMDILIKKMDPWLLLVHKKAQAEWSVYNPLTMRRPSPPSNSLKLLSWNVNGLRALLKGKGNQEPGAAILKLAEKEDFDVLSLQETKLQEKDVLTIKEALLPGYDNSLWSCSTVKLGYSGTAVISRIKPLSVSYGLGISNHDNEGRVITVEFERFFLVTSYVPNSGQKLERLAYRTEDWDSSLGNYLKELEKRKPVILTGDLNCAHQEIDIYNPDGNRRSAGFTNEERTSFEKNFLQRGLADTFRRQHPNSVGYTYWGYRTAARPKNQGWRLDYFLASDVLLDLVYDSYILPDVEGSDHCPIGLTLKC